MSDTGSSASSQSYDDDLDFIDEIGYAIEKAEQDLPRLLELRKSTLNVIEILQEKLDKVDHEISKCKDTIVCLSPRSAEIANCISLSVQHSIK